MMEQDCIGNPIEGDTKIMQMPPMSKERADQSAGGVFLIGLALLFLTGWWFPGILFVIGAASMARTLAQGKAWAKDTPALILFGLGILFGLPSFIGGWIIPVGLIGVGLYMLYGNKTGTSSTTASTHLASEPVKRKATVDTRSDLEREIDRELGRDDSTVTDAMDALRREANGTYKPKNDELF